VSFRIDLTNAAEKELRKLAKSVQPKQVQRIRDKINALATDPRPPGVEKIQVPDLELWRVRAGDYRIVYQIEDDALVIIVIRIGHRREVYRGL
jgi:mRNA interferase RelE/StbE